MQRHQAGLGAETDQPQRKTHQQYRGLDPGRSRNQPRPRDGLSGVMNAVIQNQHAE
jgi:hypothetical protein